MCWVVVIGFGVIIFFGVGIIWIWLRFFVGNFGIISIVVFEF